MFVNFLPFITFIIISPGFGDKPTIADCSIWPFVRQFKIACEHQKIDNHFDDSMIRWLNYFETNNNYKDVMNKYEIWNQSSKVSYFPLNI